jgi:HlyD family secretion protein
MQKNKFKRNILIVLALAFSISACASGQSFAEVEITNLETATITRGDISSSIYGTGNLATETSVTLYWQTEGIIEEIAVSVGDQVEADQLLAFLDETSLSSTVLLGQSDLVDAQDDLEAFYDSYNDAALAAAQLTVAQAEEEYEIAETAERYATSPPSDRQLIQAETKVATKAHELDEAIENLEYWQLHTTRARISGFLSRGFYLQRLTDAERGVNAAQEAYDVAVEEYENLLNGPDPVDVAVAEANLAVAADVLADAQADYADIAAGPTQSEIEALEAAVAAAEAVLEAKNITAPISGEITLIHHQPGDLVAAGDAVIRVDDLDTLLIEVFIHETDIQEVEIGQSVEIIFDALPGRQYSGTVAKVTNVDEPNSNGVIWFPISVEILEGDEDLKIGMSATVEINVGQAEDVLIVPIQAVNYQEGQPVIYVVSEEGNISAQHVSVGLVSQTEAEIVSDDLHEGSLVVINPVLEGLASLTNE